MRHDLFDELPKSTLRRISHFLDFDPNVPIRDFSVETKNLLKLPERRQEQWLDLHREETWKEFVQAGTPTSTYLVDGPHTYEQILLSALRHLGQSGPADSILSLETDILIAIWRRLPAHMDRRDWSRNLDEFGKLLEIPGNLEPVEIVVDRQLVARGRESARQVCNLVLTLILRKKFDLDKLLEKPPAANPPITALEKAQQWLKDRSTELINAVEEPNYTKVLPVVLEILRERLNKELQDSAVPAKPQDTLAGAAAAEEDNPRIVLSKLPLEPAALPNQIGSAESEQPTREKIRAEFMDSTKDLERYLKECLPWPYNHSKDRRGLGALIKEAAASDQIDTISIEELRQINRVRNEYVHPEPGKRDLDDARLVWTTKRTKEWLRNRGSG